MFRYAWGLRKTFDFFVSKSPDILPVATLYRQLQRLESRLRIDARWSSEQMDQWIQMKDLPDTGGEARSAGVHTASDELSAASLEDDDEAVLVHTYLNSQFHPIGEK